MSLTSNNQYVENSNKYSIGTHYPSTRQCIPIPTGKVPTINTRLLTMQYTNNLRFVSRQ